MKVRSFTYRPLFVSNVCHQIKTLISDQLNKQYKSNQTKTKSTVVKILAVLVKLNQFKKNS